MGLTLMVALALAVAFACGALFGARRVMRGAHAGVAGASASCTGCAPDAASPPSSDSLFLQGEAAPAKRLDENCREVARRFGLSNRETEVFGLLARGRSTAHIADALCISASTVKTHTYRIYRKLDIHSQQDAISLAEQG